MQDRMGNFGERLQVEAASVEARMGDGEAGLIEDEIVEQKDIKIEAPPFGNGSSSP